MGAQSRAGYGAHRGNLVKVAVVGCGRMGRVHVPYILKTPGVRLVGACDQNEIRAAELAHRHQVPPYADLAQMLHETGPDAVHIVTPPQTHAAVACEVLEAGSHALVEKPLCLTLKQADAVYSAAEVAGRLVSVNHAHLWSPLVKRARLLIESGTLGRVRYIEYVMGDDYLDALKRGYAPWAQELRGGVLCDLIPHPLYIIRAFLPDAQVASARASGSTVRDLRELWVDFASGDAGASLWMSLNQRPLEHSFRIYCTAGTICVDLRNFCMAVLPERGFPGAVARVIKTVSDSSQRATGTLRCALGVLLGRFDPRSGTRGAIEAFYEAIVHSKPSPVSAEEAGAVVELSVAIWDALERHAGAIRPVVDESGRLIGRRAPPEFAKAASAQQPTVLVTGGTGFIGSHLVRRLVADGQRLRVLCRPSSSLDRMPPSGVAVTMGDVADRESVRKAMQGIQVVYHLAATTAGDWAEHYQGTVLGTRNVLEAAAEVQARRVVYVSSLGVLHASRFPKNGVVDESFPLEERPHARGDYSRAKLDAEQLVRQFANDGDLPVCVIRPGLVYGPGHGEFLSDAGFRVSKGVVLVVGVGRRRLPLTYVENLVDALLLAAQSQDTCGRTYQIVDPISLRYVGTS